MQMDVKDIAQLYAHSPQVEALRRVITSGTGDDVTLHGLGMSSAAVVFAAATGSGAVGNTGCPSVLFILNDADEAGYFYNDLVRLTAEGSVLFFPSSYRRKIKYGQRDAANEILRTEVLARLGCDEHESATPPAMPLLTVTWPEALCERVMPREQIGSNMLKLSVGEQHDATLLQERLRDLGFTETDYVYEPGQYAVRGSILDVWSFSSEHPFRLDFFGDDIESIRTFDIETQLSCERRQTVDIVPYMETEAAQGVAVTQLLPDGCVLVAKDFDYVAAVMDRVSSEGFSMQAQEEEKAGTTPPAGRGCYRQSLSGSEVLTAVRHRFLHVTLAAGDGDNPFALSPQPLFHKNFELLFSSIDSYVADGYRLYILADSDKQHQRLKEIFAGRGDNAIDFTAVRGTLHEGYIDHTLRCLFFTDHQIFDRFHKYSLRTEIARRGKVALTMKELQEMEVGDYIVHVDLGIGKFAGLVRVPAGGGYREVIRIVYAHGDKVDVSIHSLYKVSKYRKHDSEEPPKLSTLGTGAWERLKERTKKRIKDIARDLIKLYATRRKEKGFAFSTDTYLQHELEAGFLYEDTPDQLKATNDVKADMESSRPMDRLVCGDVGFGKTEVAIRAAFKAACDSKQTAVLVPTTVLAYQHFRTFSSRLKDMPVRVDYLSRARSAKATREVLDDLAAGRIDIIIGTHKLIGKAVTFHDLGLLIIDEEQKFGVSTKEKLRKLKTNVDTLTLSATPIPRTLQFSLMGARDMSIIRTPPPNRYPICTELHTFDGDIIAEAINFEMSRNGQVFFVNNRINSLPAIAQLIHRRVPDARIAVGHGQMRPDELEQVVTGFINYDYDVLLSTTIVENGIDIPNANTIIINDAHHFGLADLHQMRGRVGRSNRKAFCYLLAPSRSDLNDDARRRLEAIETFSELGSGFNLSMQDLDIRGAGNLLGAEQSGFMEDLGYETWQKILSQAVTELKNDEFGSLYEEDIRDGRHITGEEFVDDCTIESDLEMYFPESYVPSDSERLLLYRELEHIDDDVSLEHYEEGLRDRFGRIPHEGEELLQVVPLRRIGKRLGCEKITLRQGQMVMYFVSNPDSAYYRSAAFDKVLDYLRSNIRKCKLRETKGKRSMTVSDVPTVRAAVGILREIEAKTGTGVGS